MVMVARASEYSASALHNFFCIPFFGIGAWLGHKKFLIFS